MYNLPRTKPHLCLDLFLWFNSSSVSDFNRQIGPPKTRHARQAWTNCTNQSIQISHPNIFIHAFYDPEYAIRRLGPTEQARELTHSPAISEEALDSRRRSVLYASNVELDNISSKKDVAGQHSVINPMC
jgi:hypothetical protein